MSSAIPNLLQQYNNPIHSVTWLLSGLNSDYNGRDINCTLNMNVLPTATGQLGINNWLPAHILFIPINNNNMTQGYFNQDVSLPVNGSSFNNSFVIGGNSVNWLPCQLLITMIITINYNIAPNTLTLAVDTASKFNNLTGGCTKFV